MIMRTTERNRSRSNDEPSQVTMSNFQDFEKPKKLNTKYITDI
jgi:hypothetical protein